MRDVPPSSQCCASTSTRWRSTPKAALCAYHQSAATDSPSSRTSQSWRSPPEWKSIWKLYEQHEEDPDSVDWMGFYTPPFTRPDRGRNDAGLQRIPTPPRRGRIRRGAELMSDTAQVDLPSSVDFMPTLVAMNRFGGPTPIVEIDEAVAGSLKLSGAQLEARYLEEPHIRNHCEAPAHDGPLGPPQARHG